MKMMNKKKLLLLMSPRGIQYSPRVSFLCKTHQTYILILGKLSSNSIFLPNRLSHDPQDPLKTSLHFSYLHNTWNNNTWSRRKTNAFVRFDDILIRVCTVYFIQQRCSFLRMCWYRVRRPKSFDDLQTVDDYIMKYREAGENLLKLMLSGK